jgi:hypothetical protein
MKNQKQIDALENALRHFSFNPKFGIHSMYIGGEMGYSIVTKNEIGSIVNHTPYYNYKEMNGYIKGLADSKRTNFF